MKGLSCEGELVAECAANLDHGMSIVEIHVPIDVILHGFFDRFGSIMGAYHICTHSCLVVAEVQLRHCKRFLLERGTGFLLSTY